MSNSDPFSSLASIRSLAQEIAPEIGFSEDASILKTPVHAGDLTFPNRIAIQPLEAADADAIGAPTEYTRRRYIDYADGGAGLIWFEACSLDFPEARSHGSMLVISERTLQPLKRVVEEVKERSRDCMSELGLEGRAVLVLQLSHAGRYRVEKSKRSPAIAYRFPGVDDAFGIGGDVGRVLTDTELEKLMDAFVEASSLAYMAGFDAVDVKSCHGYLLNDLLSGYTREGEYGGSSFENRSRFLLETVKAITEETGGTVTSRISAYDGHPLPYGFGCSGEVDGDTGLTGFDPSEPMRLVHEMERLGVDFVNISLGNPYNSQYLTRPYDKMMGSSDSPIHPMKGVENHFKIVETLKRSAPGMTFVGSGYSWLRQHGANAASHNIERRRVDVAGWGRLAIASPRFPRYVFETGALPPMKTCVACGSCTRLLRAGLRSGCVVQNPDEFRESMKKLDGK
jgi:2,4-dienoyl-CoA reductase (NADPH2)